MRTPPIRDLYTVEEAAKALRMGRSTLYRAINEGRIGYTVDPAGRIRFTQDDIDAALEAGRRPAVA